MGQKRFGPIVMVGGEPLGPGNRPWEGRVFCVGRPGEGGGGGRGPAGEMMGGPGRGPANLARAGSNRARARVLLMAPGPV